MPPDSLGDWLARLETLHPREIELGLERVAAVAGRMSLLKPGARVVTVAGTNGKGSTTLLLEAMALDAGLRVGVFTSPHLLRYNERVRINGTEASDEALIEAFVAIDSARGDIALTYFEFGALAALYVFSRTALDVIVLEVGLGGRLDAVNIIDADVAVITSISLDHQEWLGNDRETIGREKAGILREGVPVVVADVDPPRSVLDIAAELNCPIQLYQPGVVSLPALSGLRPENLFAAYRAAELAGFAPPGDRLEPLLAGCTLPGRVQQLRVDGSAVILDVAHNPAATEHLAQWLAARVNGPRVALFAALSDKDIHAMIRPCLGLFEHWYIVPLPEVGRSLEVADLAGRLADAGVGETTACSSMADAWQQALSLHPAATAVVFGSFFTVAEYMKLLGEGQAQA